MTGKITLEVPASLAEDLADAAQDFLIELLERGLRQSRIERALERYKQGGVSFAAAARLAGVSRSELARQAYARGLEPPYVGSGAAPPGNPWLPDAACATGGVRRSISASSACHR